VPPPAQPAPAKPAALSTPSVQIASPPTNSPTDFAVPQVKERVLPTVSANVLRFISPSVVVHVKVQIDDQGKVVKSESLTHGVGLVDTLADAAVEAARHWQFVPARRGNQSVASETVLNFTFARGN
jgi:periplasmic protein TonB